MAEQSLIPELPKDVINIVLKYFDNFWVGAPGYATWGTAKDYEHFQQEVLPKLIPRQYDDSDLFEGCSHAQEFYDVLQGKEAIVGIMGQLYRAGMSFHPATVCRIAINGGPFADWVANTFFMQLQSFLYWPYERSSEEQSFYDKITVNVQKHTPSLLRKLAKRKCDCL